MRGRATFHVCLFQRLRDPRLRNDASKPLLKVSVSKHATLEVNLAKDLPAIPTNAAQIRQIVMNLVTNASEAIGNRTGVIRVITKCVKTRRGSPREHFDHLAE